MFTLAKLVVLLTAALLVAAMPSHLARNTYNHREIAARVAQPEVVPAPEIVARDISDPAKRLIRKKRARNGRCKPKSSSVVPSSTIKEDPKPSSELAPPKATSDVKNDPTSTSNPPEEPHTIPKEDPESTTTTTHQPDPTTPPPDPTTPPPDPATPPPDSTTPQPTPTPTPAPNPSNSGGQIHTGQGTFYATGLGACGITNNDGQDIAAVSHSFFDSFPGYDGVNPNNNPMCSKTAEVTYNGITIHVKLTDRCEGCAYGDLDFSPNAFKQLADFAAGRISGISWRIID